MLLPLGCYPRKSDVFAELFFLSILRSVLLLSCSDEQFFHSDKSQRGTGYAGSM
jgi:hypothetical protein